MKKIYLLAGMLFLSLSVRGACEEIKLSNQIVKKSEDLLSDKHGGDDHHDHDDHDHHDDDDHHDHKDDSWFDDDHHDHDHDDHDHDDHHDHDHH